MRAADAVIRRPAGLRRGRREMFGTLTVLLWSGYLYLWLPLITLVAWTFGLRTAWMQWVRQVNVLDLDSLVAAVGVSVGLAGSLLLWAEYNRRRFTGVERRQRSPDVTSWQVGESLGASVEAVDALQQGAVLLIRCRADGSIAQVHPMQDLEHVLDVGDLLPHRRAQAGAGLDGDTERQGTGPGIVPSAGIPGLPQPRPASDEAPATHPGTR